MGYILTAIAVDLSKVSEAVSSRNRRLVSTLVKQFGEELEQFGYALEFLCRHFGERLPNREWSAMPSGSRWVETVDRGLAAAGVPENVLRVGRHLMNRGAPIAIPEIEDFPGIGYLKLAEVKTAQEAFGKANLAASKNKEVLPSIQELQGWLQTCADSGRDLVCFYA